MFGQDFCGTFGCQGLPNVYLACLVTIGLNVQYTIENSKWPTPQNGGLLVNIFFP